MITLILINLVGLINYIKEKEWRILFLIFRRIGLGFIKMLNFNLTTPNIIFLSNCLTLIIDELALKLIILNLLVILISLLSRLVLINNYKNNNFFFFFIILLKLIIIFCFLSSHFLILYVFFELSIIPIIMLILLWGYQPERIIAITYLFLYTCLSSIPFLFRILFFYLKLKHMSIFVLNSKQTLLPNILKYRRIILFFVKCPVYGVHLWLPKAHVEAPVAGSVILAAILLKFGGFGLIRLLNSDIVLMYDEGVLGGLFIWGTIITCLICLTQIDLKSLIAYSSVSHISFICAVLIIRNDVGLESGIATILRHGLTRISMFIFANNYYEITHTRRVFIYSGIVFLTPLITVWFLILLWINAGLPPTINFRVEMLLFIRVLNDDISRWGILSLIRCLTLAFMIVVFVRTQYGERVRSLKFIKNNYDLYVKILIRLISFLRFFFISAFII